MRYEWLMGLRYARAKRRNHFISFISTVSMLGIALGVAALIVVLSVMNGFHKELRARILSVASHVQIMGRDGPLMNGDRVQLLSEQAAGVVAAAPFVDGQAMLSTAGGVRGVLVRGVDPTREPHVTNFGPRVDLTHALLPGEFGIVLGADLAHLLDVHVGERVTMIIPQGQATPVGVIPRLKQFRVMGLFEVGMYEYDSSLALIHLEDAQKLYQMGSGVSGIRLKLDDLFDAPVIARRLAKTLHAQPLLIQDWTQSHANFFQAIQMEKRVMFVILLLIVAVAAFNIVSTLVMAVTDKRADIAILRTLGARPGSIMLIFMIQGCLIGLVGVILGTLGGVMLAYYVDVIVAGLESVLGFSFLSKEIYFISNLPSDLQWSDVLTIALTGFVLSVLATLYPSWRASRIQPVEALREAS